MCRYVRCIKPNMNKQSNDYDEDLVLDQLRYLGMLEIIRIRKMGFPVHFQFDEFVSRYKCILPRRTVLPRDHKSAAKALMDTQGLERREWQIGKAKIFLRACVHEPIEDKRMQTLNQKATVIQKRWKGKSLSLLLWLQWFHSDFRGWLMPTAHIKSHPANTTFFWV